MAPPASHVQSLQLGDTLVLTFTATELLDSQAIRATEQALLALVGRSGVRSIVVDFLGVQTLSSQMLGALIQMKSRVGGSGQRLLLCGLNPRITEIFEISSLKHVFEVCGTRAEALAVARP